jgi:hypothetical protein
VSLADGKTGEAAGDDAAGDSGHGVSFFLS